MSDDKIPFRPGVANTSRSVVRGHAMMAQHKQVVVDVTNRSLKRQIEEAQQKIEKLEIEAEAAEEVSEIMFRDAIATGEVLKSIEENWNQDQPGSQLRAETFEGLPGFKWRAEDEVSADNTIVEKFYNQIKDKQVSARAKKAKRTP